MKELESKLLLWDYLFSLEKEVLNLTILLQENLGNSDKLKELRDKRDQINKQLEKTKTEDSNQSDPNKDKIKDVKGVDDTVKLAVSVANDEITNKLIVYYIYIT